MRVLELSDREEAAAFCGKLFRRSGAEVLKVESPRRAPPARHLDIYLNGGKRRTALDVHDDKGLDALRRLAKSADLFVTDYSAADTDRLGLFEGEGDPAPRVRVSITPFGLSGLYRDRAATSSTLLALGGYTSLMGDPGREPLTMPGNYAWYQAGTFAYLAGLAAQLAPPDVAPVRVEVSVLECLASLHQFTDTMWLFGGQVRSRHGNRWENLAPTTLLPCHDGWYGVNILANFWFSFAHMIGRPDIASEGPLSTNAGRMDASDELEALITRAFWDLPKKLIFRDGQETWRVPIGYAASLGDLLEDPHLVARRFWQSVDLPERGSVLMPGPPFRFVDEETLAELPPRPYGADEPRFLSPHAGGGTGPARAGRRGGDPSRPLAGVRVLDLTRIWSGPLATRILGDLGADVIKIEAPDGRGPGARRPDLPQVERPWNRQPLFNKLSRNKKSVVLDLKKEKGRRIFLALVSKSDVVIENFSARAMPGLGLGFDALREANDRIIYVPMPAFGLSGPYRDYIGLGPSIEPVTGLTALMGYSDAEPRVTSKAVTDAMAGVAAAAAVVTALARRAETGRALLVDLSQHEAGVALLGEHFVQAQLTGLEPVRMGNAHADFVPHGVYPCAGEDQWVAVAVRDDAEWAALCEVVGLDALKGDSRFASAASRRDHREAIDREVARCTAAWGKRDLESALQERGVAAGTVLSAPEWLSDPHLQERGFFVRLEHPEAGGASWDGLPVTFDGSRTYEGWTAAPLLGQHNREVLADFLEMDAEAVESLYAEGVLAESPPPWAGDG